MNLIIEFFIKTNAEDRLSVKIRKLENSNDREMFFNNRVIQLKIKEVNLVAIYVDFQVKTIFKSKIVLTKIFLILLPKI